MNLRELSSPRIALAFGCLLTVAGSAAGGEVDSARKLLRNEIGGWTLVPKVDIGMAGVFNVHPDGRPTSKRQGRMGGNSMSAMAQRRKAAICMASGRQYTPRHPKVDADPKKIELQFFPCSTFVIHFERAVEVADLQPSAVAAALAGFFDIHGPQVASSRVESLISEALSPIEVRADKAFFRGLAFAHPEGWTPEKFGQELYYRGEDKREIRIRARDLKAAEVEAGARVMLEEVLPERLLESARKLDEASRVLHLSRVQVRDGLSFGWADIVYKRVYERHDWILDFDAARLYTFRSKGKERDSQLFRSAISRILSTARRSEPDPRPKTPSIATRTSDLPAPTDFGLPGGSSSPFLETFEARALPQRVRLGESIELGMRYEIAGPENVEVEVRETRTLVFQGQVLPNYPVIDESSLAVGSHDTVLPERIPDFADPGRYELRCELCVAGECRTRVVEFEVVR